MRRGQQPSLAVDIEEVRERVEHWRKTRRKRSPMPQELWEAAASLAGRHGVYPIARALRVNYESLKKRVGRATGDGREAEVRTGGFVELSAEQLFGAGAPPGPVVELADGHGAQVTIRLSGRESLDVVALVDTFWRRPA